MSNISLFLSFIVYFRAPRRGKSRQLWDRTVERWEHDKYKEEEQGPKEPWEIEVCFTVNDMFHFNGLDISKY